MLSKLPVLMLLFLTLGQQVALSSGYPGDLGQAWEDATSVVIGPVTVLDRGIPHGREVSYEIGVEESYKTSGGGKKLRFLDPAANSSAGVFIKDGGTYLVFLRYTPGVKEEIPVVLRAYAAGKRERPEVESALAALLTFKSLPLEKRNAFLLKNLSLPNRYIHSFIVRETLKAKLKESIPYFQQQLNSASTESDKLDHLASLRCLEATGLEKKLLEWMNDPAFKDKGSIMQEMFRTGNRVYIPSYRSRVNDPDELVSVTARTILLQMGEKDGKDLVFEVLRNYKNPIARYNAIHTLHWDYRGTFTDAEKSQLQSLAKDQDPAISRVAGLILEMK